MKFSHFSNIKFRHKFIRLFKTRVTVVLKLKQLNIFFLRCQFLASEKHNLHHDLCLIDPPVINFDGESLLTF